MKIVSEEKQYLTAVALNAVIFLAEIVGFVLSAAEFGAGLFVYYTELSNILLAVSSFFVLFSAYFNLRKGCGTNYPTHLLRYAATTSSTLTLLIVLVVLTPVHPNPTKLLFGGSMFLHHLLCPLLSLTSFLFFEKQESRNLKYSHIPFALISIFLYGIVLIVLNIINVVNGPYLFLRVHAQPVWATILWITLISGISTAVSFLLCLGNKKIFYRGIIRHG